MRVITLLVSLLFIHVAWSCKCVPPTQGTAYCRSQWITRAKVKYINPLSSTIEYGITNSEIFKSNLTIMPNKVFTPTSSAACGVTDLKIGNEYLFAGTTNDITGALQLSTCLYMPAEDYQSTVTPLLWSQVPQELVNKLRTKSFPLCPI